MNYYTATGRLLASGWEPGAAIARVVLQREALWAALAEVSALSAESDAVLQAVRRADREAIVEAITRAAVVEWCNSNLQRGFEVEAVYWDLELRDALSDLIAADPRAVLQSLEDLGGDVAAEALREEARGYLDHALVVMDPRGRPVPAKALRHGASRIPRVIRPLAPLPEPVESDGVETFDPVTEETAV